MQHYCLQSFRELFPDCLGQAGIETSSGPRKKREGASTPIWLQAPVATDLGTTTYEEFGISVALSFGPQFKT